MKVQIPALWLAALALCLAPATARAQSVVLHPLGTAGAANAEPPETSVHRYFGLVEAAGGTDILIRLRNGRTLRVDASRAFALTRVSEPLFTGKSVVVRGFLAPGNVFRATSVQKASRQVTSWGADT